jgi:hypothetical protein
VRKRISRTSTRGSGSRSAGLRGINRSSTAAANAMEVSWTIFTTVAGASPDALSSATHVRSIVRSILANGVGPSFGMMWFLA